MEVSIKKQIKSVRDQECQLLQKEKQLDKKQDLMKREIDEEKQQVMEERNRLECIMQELDEKQMFMSGQMSSNSKNLPRQMGTFSESTALNTNSQTSKINKNQDSTHHSSDARHSS